MLVLSRKVGESLVLSDQNSGEVIATIRISRVHGNRVTIGVEAPEEVRVVRGELKPERNPNAPATK